MTSQLLRRAAAAVSDWWLSRVRGYAEGAAIDTAGPWRHLDGLALGLWRVAMGLPRPWGPYAPRPGLPRLRLWRIGFGSLEDCSVIHRSAEWRRLWWRIWVADVFPMMRSSTRCWLTWRAGQVLAALSLAEGGVLAACEAMKRLNRAAKHTDDADRDEIYALKRRFIGELLERFPCEITAHEQALKCRGCAGTGTWVSDSGRYSDACYRCDGTGVYRRHVLLLFTFTICQRVYHWHQPAEYWPDAKPVGDVTPYLDLDLRTGRTFVSPGLEYETLIETVAQWIDAQGLPLGMPARPRGWDLRRSIAGDIRRIRQRVGAWRDRRRPRGISPAFSRLRLPRFPDRGAAAALHDLSLPF